MDWRRNVSRETLEKLSIYHDLLLRWQKVKNLISKNTVNEIWERHIADSAQLFHFESGSGQWVDMGSGGGFPGMVVAIMSADRSCASHFTLIESDHRKCAFLREVARETGAPVTVVCSRIEDVLPDLEQVDFITARALAPLSVLVEYSLSKIQSGAVGLFLKGQDVERELIALPKYSMLSFELLDSETDKRGRIVRVVHRDYL